jgi:hypothetical protein
MEECHALCCRMTWLHLINPGCKTGQPFLIHKEKKKTKGRVGGTHVVVSGYGITRSKGLFHIVSRHFYFKNIVCNCNISFAETISVADPGSGEFLPLDPRSGMGKNSDPG